MKKNIAIKKIVILGLLLTAFSALSMSCKSLAPEDIRPKTVALSLRILELMEKADHPYAKYEDQVLQLVEDIHAHYDLTKSIKRSEFILEQWNILLRDEKETLLLTQYFEKWQKESVLDSGTIQIGISNVRIVLENIKAAENALYSKYKM